MKFAREMPGRLHCPDVTAGAPVYTPDELGVDDPDADVAPVVADGIDDGPADRVAADGDAVTDGQVTAADDAPSDQVAADAERAVGQEREGDLTAAALGWAASASSSSSSRGWS